MLRSSLKDADLCFIPKPNKPATKPSNLRPLGIIRPDGKGLAGACRDLLAPITETYLRDLPQFAYQPKRGLSDALRRVVRHVRLVRPARMPGAPDIKYGSLRSARRWWAGSASHSTYPKPLTW